MNRLPGESDRESRDTTLASVDPGRNAVFAGLICAVLAVFVSPLILGVLGFAAGAIAVAQHARGRG